MVDGSDFPKQGSHSVGVKRQCCGELGKRANCQAGVFVGYVSLQGYTVLDRRLYVPVEWLTDEAYPEPRRQCGLPGRSPLENQARVGPGRGGVAAFSSRRRPSRRSRAAWRLRASAAVSASRATLSRGGSGRIEMQSTGRAQHEFAAGARGGDDRVHELCRADDRVDRTGLNAERAADAAFFVDDGDTAWRAASTLRRRSCAIPAQGIEAFHDQDCPRQFHRLLPHKQIPIRPDFGHSRAPLLPYCFTALLPYCPIARLHQSLMLISAQPVRHQVEAEDEARDRQRRNRAAYRRTSRRAPSWTLP